MSGVRSSGSAPTEAAGGAGGPPSEGGRGPRADMHDEQGDLLPGVRLGKYEIVRQLGSGGMGAVYEAVHTSIGRPVALKTLTGALATQARAQARFLREAAAASRLEHPNVVTVTDYGVDEGVSYIVMELLRGEDLGGLLGREGALPVERVVDIMLAVSAGVFAAHEVGVVHRDLKPQNIFLARTPVGETVAKVLDFGISKLVDDEPVSSLTGTGTVLGTTPYLSPEQVAGRPVDARSDQYTVGVILYECITGRRPHEGDSLYMIMKSISEGTFPPLSELRPEVPAAFEAVVLKAMSCEASSRFESVHALGRALLAFATPRGQMLWQGYFAGVAEVPVLAPVGTGRSGPVTPASGPMNTRLLAPAAPLLATHTKPRGTPAPATADPFGRGSAGYSAEHDLGPVAGGGAGKKIALAAVVLAVLGGAGWLLLGGERKVVVEAPETAGLPSQQAQPTRRPPPPEVAATALPEAQRAKVEPSAATPADSDAASKNRVATRERPTPRERASARAGGSVGRKGSRTAEAEARTTDKSRSASEKNASRPAPVRDDKSQDPTKPDVPILD